MWTERYCKSGAGDCNDGDKGESWRMAASVREEEEQEGERGLSQGQTCQGQAVSEGTGCNNRRRIGFFT